MDKYEICAALLQYPLISTSNYAHFIELGGQIRTFDANERDASNAFHKIQANGVGNHCRWMLTDEALIVRRADGSFVAKPRPAELPYESAIAYRAVFSFCSADSDFIVLSANRRIFIVRVNANNVEEEHLDIDVCCFSGYSTTESDYALFGQTPRPKTGGYGSPAMVEVKGSQSALRKLAPITGIKLESIIAMIPAPTTRFLVGAETPRPASMEDFDFGYRRFSDEYDQDRLWLFAQDQSLNIPPLKMEDTRFVGCVGPKFQERAFFESKQKIADGRNGQAMMISVKGDGSTTSHEIAGLDYKSSILRIQFDPLIGWFGIADQHNAVRDRYLLSSSDGNIWGASRIS